MIPDNKLVGVSPTHMFNLSDDDEQSRVEYNKNIESSITEEYAAFQPQNQIIVRCYVLEWVKQGSVTIPPMVKVPVRTHNGMAFKEYNDSPWPYARKAIVVAVPEGYSKYKVGDKVLLDKHCVLSTKENVEADFHMPKGFTVDSWYDLEPPKDMKSEHYGYLIVHPQAEILGKLKTEDNG